MVKVIHKKDKKYIIIDGREYGSKSLYFHIQRTISSLEYFTKNGQWDENRQMKAKAYIERYLKAYKENFQEYDLW